jgi:Holliday junction DNA helicase RuvB
VARFALDRLEIDELGLDMTDRRMIEAIITYYDGGPVGLETLAATIGEEAITIEDVYEPYLMQLGFIQRTPRGRCVTRLAYEHLGLKPPVSKAVREANDQLKFFEDTEDPDGGDE